MEDISPVQVKLAEFFYCSGYACPFTYAGREARHQGIPFIGIHESQCFCTRFDITLQ